MDAAQSDVEREAREFMEENEPLIEDGGLFVLQRVFVQGAQIAKALSADTVEAANRATYVTNTPTAAIRDRSTHPRRIQELDTERERLLPIFERKSKAFDQFSNFMDRVEEVRQRREAEAEQG